MEAGSRDLRGFLPYGLLAEEEEKILEIARREEYGDLGHRHLAIVASDKGIVEGSASRFCGGDEGCPG